LAAWFSRRLQTPALQPQLQLKEAAAIVKQAVAVVAALVAVTLVAVVVAAPKKQATPT
jgi:hypothetical protein